MDRDNKRYEVEGVDGWHPRRLDDDWDGVGDERTDSAAVAGGEVTSDSGREWPSDMSPFEQTKREYPNANQALIEGRWVIFTDYSETRALGKGGSAKDAWADAWRNIQATHKGGER